MGKRGKEHPPLFRPVCEQSLPHQVQQELLKRLQRQRERQGILYPCPCPELEWVLIPRLWRESLQEQGKEQNQSALEWAGVNPSAG